MNKTPEKNKRDCKKYKLNQKQKIFELLGGENGVRCFRCGFEDIRALQIDHKFGGGLVEWKQVRQNRIALYKLIRANPIAYQLLCANCNWIKRFENGE